MDILNFIYFDFVARNNNNNQENASLLLNVYYNITIAIIIMYFKPIH
jgi:hypothetical protein